MSSWLRVPPARALLPRTFAARLALANSLLIVLICVTLSWVLARRYLDHVGNQLSERGRTMSDHLAREAGRSLMAGLHGLEQQARAEGGIAYVRFFDAHGLLLASGGMTPVGAAVPPPTAGSGARGPIAVGPDLWEFRAPIFASDRQPLRDPSASPVSAGLAEPRQWLGTVAVGVSLDSLGVLRRRTLGTAILFTSLFAVVAVLGAARIAHATARPLKELAAAADAVGRGDFSVQVPVEARDEVGGLARSFNAMVESLRRSATLEEKVRELQEVTRLKSEFLAAVSHELRTPLNVIIGYTEMIASGAGGSVTAEQEEMLDTVRRYSKLQLELINNVLDYSRLVSGRMSFHVERFELLPLLDEILAMHRGRLRNRPLVLTAFVDPEVPRLETDRIKLHEIVRNLVDNAVKFTPAGSVSAEACAGTSPGWVAIEVTDTGPGMRPEDLQRIFEAFQQVGRGHTGGVGLGLSIVKQLVDALGGTVSVTSAVGQGSTFRVEIPCVLDVERELAGDVSPLPAALDGVSRNVALLREQTRAAARPRAPQARAARGHGTG